MLSVLLGGLISFFAAFGFIEFIRFVYTEWNKECKNYHVVIPVKNSQDKIECIVRNAIMNNDASSIIAVDFNSTDDTYRILQSLSEKFSSITVLTYDEYIEFLQSKDC